MKRTVWGPNGPEEVDLTPEEVAEREAEEALPPPPPSALDQLKAVFVSLPIEVQASFGPLAAAVYMFLDQNNPDAAMLVIQQAEIPEELEAVRQQMLGVFDA